MNSSSTLVSDLLAQHEVLIQACLTRLDSFYLENVTLQSIANDMPLDETALVRFALVTREKYPTRNDGDGEEYMFTLVCDMLKLRETHLQVIQRANLDDQSSEFPLHLPGKLGGFLGNDLLVVTDLGKTNLNLVAEQQFNNNKDLAVEHGLLCGEYLRLACDKRTRETGKLCRMVNVVDLEGISVFNMNQMMLQAIGANSSMSEILNPMLISQVILIRAPWSIGMIMGMLKPFIPRHVMDTLQYCKNNQAEGEIHLCPFVSKFIDGASNVPKTIGGLFDAAAPPAATTLQQTIRG